MTELSDHLASVMVRQMRQEDVPELLRLMQGIVTYERGTGFALTEDDLRRWGFGPQALFGAFVAEERPGTLAGMAVHYTIPFMHSTRPLLMMKWLFVDPEVRSRGIGRLLMQAVAKYALDQGHANFSWFVLKDNEKAQKFYRSLGAEPDPEWDRWKLPEAAVATLAAQRA